MSQHEPPPADDRVPAFAISWLVLGCMAAMIVVGLFLMVRTP